MGIEWYAVDLKNKVCFQLGKGNWSKMRNIRSGCAADEGTWISIWRKMMGMV